MKWKKTFECFYFTWKETKIYESFTFLNKLQYIFHDILIVVDVPVGILKTSRQVCWGKL